MIPAPVVWMVAGGASDHTATSCPWARKERPVDQLSKARLSANVHNAPKMISNWIMVLAGALGAIWFALPPDQQLLLLQNSPLPAWSYPIVLTAVGVIARVWPQKSLMPPAPPVSDDVPTQPLQGDPQ